MKISLAEYLKYSPCLFLISVAADYPEQGDVTGEEFMDDQE